MHELDPAWDPPPPDADRYKQPDQIIARLTGLEGPGARLAPPELAGPIRRLTVRINALEGEVTVFVKVLAAPSSQRRRAPRRRAPRRDPDIIRFRNKDPSARHT